MHPRIFSLLTLLWSVLGLSAIAMLNWLVDPFAQYQTGILPPLIQDSRKEKLALLEASAELPEGLILGSSRVMKIEPHYLTAKTGLRFFNAGVNHGRPADYLAWIRWYQQRWQRYPKLVVLGVDTAALHRLVPVDGRITAEPALADEVPELVTWKDRWERATELLGFKQTRASLQSIATGLRRQGRASPAEYFAADGRIVYREREAKIQEGTYDFAAALRYNEGEFQQLYRDFDDLSLVEVVTLIKTVENLIQHGTEVYLFNTPFHPELQRSLEPLPYFAQRQQEAKRLLELLADRYGVSIADFSDIESFEGDESDFVDGIHPLESNTRRMMDQLLANPGAKRYALQ
jgi:hypothetical protein